MNTEESSFIHVEVSSNASQSYGQGIPSPSSQEAPAHPVTHIRMGRGMVAVARYEKNTPKSQRPTTSLLVPPAARSNDSAPSPVDFEMSPGGTTKRKWYRPSIRRRRNTSLQGDSAAPANRTKTSESPMRANDEPTSVDEMFGQGEGGPGPSTLASRIPYLDTITTSESVSSSSSRGFHHLPNIASNPTSPEASIRSVITQDDRDNQEDEDRLILLEALGLTPHTQSVPIEGEGNEQGEHGNHLVTQEELHNTPTSVPTVSHTPVTQPSAIRRLPALPSSAQPPAPNQSKMIHGLPRDSQDALDYVFGSNPGSSPHIDSPGSNGPPPPYVSRQSAMT